MNAMDKMDAIDPFTLVVVQNGLQQVASEMDLTFERAAFSPVISEGFERSDGIYSRHNGEVIAQGELGLPIFVGVMQFTTRAVIDHVKASAEPLRPGDIFIVNDPYCGGTHLMDVKMVKPYFYRGELWAYLSNTGHCPDTGGSVPGGFSTRATEVQQEGLRLPPVKLFREGVMQPDILSIILANIRVPEERIGDIKAQVAALTVGEKRLTALLDRYGEATVTACIVELRRRSDLMMRAHIAKIPDGAYSGEAFVDSDGLDPVPLKERHFIMYVFSGGGYGGSADDDGLTNGCSTIGISKTQPTEVLEQHYPILFERYALREGSGGAGKTRGGFGVDYKIRIRRGEALLSVLMDHGRVGPPSLFRRVDGAPHDVVVSRPCCEY